MIVLGCETSCDETGLAVYDTEAGLLAHALYSQIDLHALYGGVVPELASRDHIRRLVPLTREVLEQSGLSLAAIDGFAYTAGPGLAGALLTGAMMMRSLAWSVGRPALGVHHLEGHLLAPMLEPDPPPYPFVCLLVSGGHTQLVRVDGLGLYRLLGESVDDAAGEAFDKTAKMLGIPYPGGKALAEMALEGDPTAIALPRPMLDRPGLDFSFSGLKTAAITRYRAELQRIENERIGSAQADPSRTEPDDSQATSPGREFMVNLAASFEAAVVDVLVTKSSRALEQERLERLVVSGGVSANRQLRQAVTDLCEQRGGQAYFPRLEFCTDNGAMIALAGALRLARGQQETLAVSVRPRWPLVELPQHWSA